MKIAWESAAIAMPAVATVLYLMGKPADATLFLVWACFAELRVAALKRDEKDKE